MTRNTLDQPTQLLGGWSDAIGGYVQPFQTVGF
jgi:hypothetical protein